jgi:hypothetical protein
MIYNINTSSFGITKHDLKTYKAEISHTEQTQAA